MAQVAASIIEFGFTNPILVDSKNGIIAGHCRLRAAQLLKLTEVPVIPLDHLSEAQKRAYITQFLSQQALLSREINWAADFFKTGVWTTDVTGVASAPGVGYPHGSVLLRGAHGRSPGPRS